MLAQESLQEQAVPLLQLLSTANVHHCPDWIPNQIGGGQGIQLQSFAENASTQVSDNELSGPSIVGGSLVVCPRSAVFLEKLPP